MSQNPARLQSDVEATIGLAFFSKSDVIYALDALKMRMNEHDLAHWCSDKQQQNDGKKVLFLHAGNLPLVGFQDVVAAYLSGCYYVGKLSRKDPFLLAGFLDILRARDPEFKAHYSTDLEDVCQGNSFDAVVFSGSLSSVAAIRRRLESINAIKKTTSWLIRKAHYSVYYVSKWNRSEMDELMEAMLRYEGKGCRSVGLIISPQSLKSAGYLLNEFADKKALELDRQGKKPPVTDYYGRWFESRGNTVIDLHSHILVDAEPLWHLPNTVFYLEGHKQTLEDYVRSNRRDIQQVYTKHGHDVGLLKTEAIAGAQTPVIYWQADGIDVLKWLCQDSGECS